VGLRSTAAQLTGVAAIGLFLALTGVHGLLAYNVNRRTRELGIRRVLGATTGGVLRLVLSDAARLAAIGVAVGLAAASIGMRWIGEVTAHAGSGNSMVYAAAASVTAAAALASAWIPARRAARVSPQEALRN
jgi:putative ABC transport system permease protein